MGSSCTTFLKHTCPSSLNSSQGLMWKRAERMRNAISCIPAGTSAFLFSIKYTVWFLSIELTLPAWYKSPLEHGSCVVVVVVVFEVYLFFQVVQVCLWCRIWFVWVTTPGKISMYVFLSCLQMSVMFSCSLLLSSTLSTSCLLN